MTCATDGLSAGQRGVEAALTGNTTCGLAQASRAPGSGWIRVWLEQARLNRLPPWHPLAAGEYRALTLRRTEI